MNELFILDECGPLFKNPKFPRVYGTVKDTFSVKNLILMDDLSSFGASCPSNLGGIKLLKVIDCMAEF